MENRFLSLIEKSIKAHWELPVFSDHNGVTCHYGDFAGEIERFHILLEKAGIEKGDKVAIIGRNSTHWAICFFGTLAYGAVIVPILHDFKPDNVHHIVNHSEAKALLTAAESWDELDEKAMPDVRFFMKLDDFSVINCNNPEVFDAQKQIDELFNRKYPEGFGPENVSYHIEGPEELAVLNYTSGTTGFSKGVMLPYRSLWSNTQFAYDRLPFIKSGDTFVCMLPMAHMYGLAFEILNGVNKGCHIHFLARTPSPNIIVETFARVKPALILVVPLIIEKIIRQRVFPQLKTPVMRILLRLPFAGKAILEKVAGKLYESFGGCVSEVVIGGAALNKEVEAFLKKINFRYTVGYGMTECGPLVAYSQWDSFKAGSVGQIVDRMEVKIDSDSPSNHVGEIIVRGTNVMLGYYKNPEATAEIMLEDGWMKTGDLGLLDKDGFLFLKGRSKFLILGSNGQNIYPEEIEVKLNHKPYIIESVVISKEGKVVALIYPDWDALRREGKSKREINGIIGNNISQLNQEIPAYSKVSSFKLHSQPFEKTPKRSIRRYLYQPK